MFAFAILIGVYSYFIFILGVLHLLYPVSVVIVTLLWSIGVIGWYRKDIQVLVHKIGTRHIHIPKFSHFSKICIFLLLSLWSINLVGALAPEISFDALWYHLTIPKIFINNNSFFFIEGGLYYYSLMPKVIDLLYIPSLMLGSDTGAKLIHYTFGLLTLLALYQISRRFLSLPLTLFVLVVFSSNLVVAWESTTAYIDLGRTFFEVMAVYGVVLFLQEKKSLWLIESAIMLGLAVSTKLVAILSLPIFILLLIYIFKDDLKKAVMACMQYSVITLLIPVPFFIFSLINSGTPIYPLFTEYYPTVIEKGITSLPQILHDYWILLVKAADPINPLYLISAPLLFFVYPRLKRDERIFVIYGIFSMLVWLITPRTGGGRFILPYLPVFSLLVGLIVKKIPSTILKSALVGIGVLVAGTTIGYRFLASNAEVKVLTGDISKTEYIKENLNFAYGDFYDVDGRLSQLFDSDDTVLVYGIHNLYYADFQFIHESYSKPGDEFNYILAPLDMKLPDRFYAWNLVYTNSVSNIAVYSQGGNTWVY